MGAAGRYRRNEFFELSGSILRYFPVCAACLTQLLYEGQMQANDHLPRRSGNLNPSTA